MTKEARVKPMAMTPEELEELRQKVETLKSELMATKEGYRCHETENETANASDDK